jgi:hypothetical protein
LIPRLDSKHRIPACQQLNLSILKFQWLVLRPSFSGLKFGIKV